MLQLARDHVHKTNKHFRDVRFKEHVTMVVVFVNKISCPQNICNRKLALQIFALTNN